MAEKAYKEYAFTPVGRVSFPHIFEAKVNDNNGKLQWSLVLAFPKTPEMIAELKKLKGVMEKVAKKNFGEAVDLTTLRMKTFKDGDKPNQNGVVREEWKGYYLLNLACNAEGMNAMRPGVVGPNKETLTDATQFYPGCWAKAQVCVASFQHKIGGRGVTLYLANIQKTRDDAPLAGGPRAEDVFDVVATENDGGVAAGDEDLF